MIYALSSNIHLGCYVVLAAICYSWVAGILIPTYKRIGCGYHTIHIRMYPLPVKN